MHTMHTRKHATEQDRALEDYAQARRTVSTQSKRTQSAQLTANTELRKVSASKRGIEYVAECGVWSNTL